MAPLLMTRSEALLAQLRFPVQYLEIGEAMVRERGEDVQGFYRDIGLDLPRPFTPWHTMDGVQLQRAMMRFLKMCPPGVPPVVPFMANFPLTVHGPIGMLAITSATLGEALQGAIRYAPLVMPAFSMQREDIGDEVHIVQTPQADFGAVQDFLTETVVLAPTKIIPFLRKPIEGVTIHFRHAALGNPDRYAAAFDGRYVFGSKQNMLVFNRSMLATPLIAPSKASHLMMRATLEQQRKTRVNARPVTTSVKERLGHALRNRQALSAESVAESMTMSVRTLSRRLQAEGSTLPRLCAEVGIEHARALLRDTDMSIAFIANSSGFTDPTAFARAFKRATGVNPSEFRKQSLKGE